MQSNTGRNDRLDSIVCTQFFSWTPIFIGALIAFGLGFLLDLFGKGIGLSAYTTDVDGATALAIGGFIGLIIGAIATMFPAGFAAGFFAAPTCAKRNYGVVYGFVAWCLGLLLMALFASSIGINASHYFSQAPNRPPVATTTSPTTNEVAATTQNVATRLHPATDRTDTMAERNVRAMGMISLSMFVIFFVGALSACFGGFWGFLCWDKWDESYRANYR